jgi:hypothetical protein
MTAVRNLEQCEGCPEPLSSYLDEYERGEVNVTWILCPYHERGVKYLYEPSEEYQYLSGPSEEY